MHATSRRGRELSVVGRYASRSAAYERALVVLAMEIPHWIIRDSGTFQLCVEPPRAAAVLAELEKFERERVADAAAPEPVEKTSTHSLFAAAAVMALFFALQNIGPAWLEDAGASDSARVLHGEWWRVLTALTLHADFSHIGANLAAGLVLAAFLLPLFGAGWTWLGILLSGALGNWLNAWGHRGEMQNSIGSSTAVFGALGLLVSAQIVSRIFALRKISTRDVLLPLGAALALLAYLGVGDAQTDFTAHFFGLLAGLPLGAAALALRLKQRTPPAAQLALGLAAPALLVLAWAFAIAHA